MPTIDVAGGEVEYELIAERTAGKAPLVFLHEGLGSVALWRNLPSECARETGRTVLAYSRHGHGWSSVVAAPRRPDYMHREAMNVLPELLERFDIRAPILIGHSDGASIAIIHAGGGRPSRGLVLLAPHVFVEERSVRGIEAARAAYLSGDLSRRLKKHHRDADATFWGWNDIWLSDGFRSWNIESYLPGVTCPVLVIQGADDPYGTGAQVDSIKRQAGGQVTTLVLPGCGHSPHLEAPTETRQAILDFLRQCP